MFLNQLFDYINVKTVEMKLELINQKIHQIRGQKVMLDYDLAALYGVETRALKQAVRRNMDRFPLDFMFRLNEVEIDEMVSHFVIPSKSQLGGASPFAFTEQGVAMLSSVLKSKTAIEINIQIMRAFVTIRQVALTNKELSERLSIIEKHYDKQFSDVYEAINFLLKKDKQNVQHENRPRIGYQ